jgi:hypothetical protein
MLDTVAPSSEGLLSNYWLEKELAQEAKVSKRYLRKLRQLREGPPWAKYCRIVVYPKAGAREWLRTLVVEPVRSRKVT